MVIVLLLSSCSSSVRGEIIRHQMPRRRLQADPQQTSKAASSILPSTQTPDEQSQDISSQYSSAMNWCWRLTAYMRNEWSRWVTAAPAGSVSQTWLFPHKVILKLHYCWQTVLLMKCYINSMQECSVAALRKQTTFKQTTSLQCGAVQM